MLVCTLGAIVPPLGLPATVTSILTLIARKLAGKNVYLKKLDVVEALGQVGIIASDKTGTLTKNQMTVTDLWYYDESIAGKQAFSSRKVRKVTSLFFLPNFKIKYRLLFKRQKQRPNRP